MPKITGVFEHFISMPPAGLRKSRVFEEKNAWARFESLHIATAARQKSCGQFDLRNFFALSFLASFFSNELSSAVFSIARPLSR